MGAVRAAFPRATAASLAVLTGQSVRAAERQLASEREISTAGVLALLRSDLGFAILAAVMDEVPAPRQPAWWRGLSRAARDADARSRLAAAAAERKAIAREEQLDLALRLRGPAR